MNVDPILVFTPLGLPAPELVIAATRAGALGVLDPGALGDPQAVAAALATVERFAAGDYGLYLPELSEPWLALLRSRHYPRLTTLVLRADDLPHPLPDDFAHHRLLVETVDLDTLPPGLAGRCHGLIVKGFEAGGEVGEETAFVLAQKALAADLALPVYVRGGIGLHSAAACRTAGAAGVVLDQQLLLLDESPVRATLEPLLRHFSGTDTITLGAPDAPGRWLRVWDRPGHPGLAALKARQASTGYPELRAEVLAALGWHAPARDLLPLGQDAALAAAWARRFRTVGGALQALRRAVAAALAYAADTPPLAEHAPLARDLGTRYPIVQGPMSRVSDNAAFAAAVADGGALPMLALALLPGARLDPLFADTARRLAGRPWGVGLLGFAPAPLLAEQVAAARRHRPAFALIAGGRPEQAVELEHAGIPAFLHVPTPALLGQFLEQGARRFVFEGRECGGHLGPLAGFVLWETMVDTLLERLADPQRAAEVAVLFAGGIHDARSAAMISAIAAPLAERGVKVGVVMGTAYLFTREIVESGALVATFQRQALACRRTVSLVSGPGHASRCVDSPFARQFLEEKQRLERAQLPAAAARAHLEALNLGRLRLAAKGEWRRPGDGRLERPDQQEQQRLGMYMIGQVAVLRTAPTTIAELHRAVTTGAAQLLAALPAPAAAPAPPPCDVAIVGLAALMPKAATTGEFWDNILDNVDAISEIPAQRWDWRLYFDADRDAPDKVYSKWGGFLDDLPFDPLAFGLPPKSLAAVDPMQLMALEVVRRALADAGYAQREYDRERVAVVIGASGGVGDVGLQYGLRAELPRFAGRLAPELAARLPQWSEDSFAGILPNVTAGRAANRFDFGGVNFTVDAACASSLAALYQAVNELTAGRADMAIAGGVDTVQGPFGYLCFAKTQALSPSGRCRTFDAAADGIVIAEGLAMVVLKRLADAERDGDRIYAVLKGVGGSSDGRAKGLTAPLPAGQLRALRRAYAQAGFAPRTVQLFEAHGTGTAAGDRAELETTGRLLAGAGPRCCAIGSVKTQVGHTKASAGVAGLIKAALALYHRVLPPHANVRTPSAPLTRPDSPLYLVREAQPWVAPAGHPRRAAVSAFGFGGTNFHAVLEEYQGEFRPRPAPKGRWPAELLVWRAADRAGLGAALGALHAALAGPVALPLRDLAYTLARADGGGPCRLAVVAEDLAQLRERVGAALKFLTGEATALPEGCWFGDGPVAGRLAVLFPGQGSQYPDMLREVALLFPPIAEALAVADRALGEPGAPLSRYVYPGGRYAEAEEQAARERLTRTEIAQPALGAVEAGLYQLLTALGLAPDMAAGHSFGEYVALWAAGCLDLEALLRLAEARGRLIVAAAGGADLGTMAAVQAPRAQVEALAAADPAVTVANHNAPNQTIVSGARAAIARLGERLVAAGIGFTPLPVAAAFHSPLVEPARAAFADYLGQVALRPPAFPVYSNTTGAAHAPEPAAIAAALVEHLVRPVEFVREVEAMYQAGARLFLEVGPKSVLTRLVGQILRDRPHTALALEGGRGGLPGLLAALGRLVGEGLELCLDPLFAGRGCRLVDLGDLAGAAPARPAHLWLLNGSRARPAGVPPEPVGVTVETAPVEASPPAAKPVLSRKRTVMTDEVSSEEDGRRGVLDAYFDTMRQFLQTQESVMLAYLGEAAPRRRSAAPVAAPRPALPVRAPVVAPAPAPVPAPAPAAPAAALDRAAVQQKLLAIVEERTGYPADMLGLDQDMEADLGIDSIKRVEIAGALMKALPAVAGERGELNGQKTLGGMVEWVLGHAKGGAALPFESAGVGTPVVARARLPRYLPRARAQNLDHLAEEPLPAGAVVVSTDAAGIAAALAEDLTRTGAVVVTLDGAACADLAWLRQEAQALRMRCGRVGALIHLAPVGRAVPAAGPAPWRAATARADKALFLLLQVFGDDLADGGRVVAASDLGGHFGRDGPGIEEFHTTAIGHNRDGSDHDCRSPPRGRCDLSGVVSPTEWTPGGALPPGRYTSPRQWPRPVGGAVGLLKCAREEWPALQAKAVDLDPAQPAAANARALLRELRLPGGRVEVGYPGGARTVFTTEPAPLADDAPPLRAPGRDWVVLATGGVRGITAEVLRELAPFGLTLVLTGRAGEPPPEPPELHALAGEAELRDWLIARARTAGHGPAAVRRELERLLRERETRACLAELRRLGARVQCRAVEMRDEAQVAALLAGVYAEFGRLDGVVHAAGVIEDKAIAAKTLESWERVYDTKVDGLLALARHLRPADLRFFLLFASVAGRYGNSGQSDYAAANEAMNRLAWQLHARWPEVKVAALNWGPWAATRHGKGMVTPETERKFAARGVHLVTPELGARLFVDEILHGPLEQVEVIAGEGPWEAHEAAAGALRPAMPLLRGARVAAGQVSLTLSLADHPYLDHHRVDGVPVLPAAVALELAAEAVARLWPERVVAEVSDFRLLHGVRLVADQDVPLLIRAQPSADPAAGACTVAVEIRPADPARPPHYRGLVHLADAVAAPAGFHSLLVAQQEPAVSVAAAYREWLFHGPLLQTMTGITALLERGALAEVAASAPALWCPGAAAAGWLFDPGVLDCAPQMAIVWARAVRGESALPHRFGRVRRYGPIGAAGCRMHFLLYPGQEPDRVRADVAFVDAAGRLLLMVEELECTSSAALARLGGHAAVSVGS